MKVTSRQLREYVRHEVRKQLDEGMLVEKESDVDQMMHQLDMILVTAKRHIAAARNYLLRMKPTPQTVDAVNKAKEHLDTAMDVLS